MCRKVLGDEDYYRLVEVLKSISVLSSEEPADTHREPNLPEREVKEDLEIDSTILAMAKREESEAVEVTQDEDGTIYVPSFVRTAEENPVAWLKSYEGGMQGHCGRRPIQL